MIVHGEVGAKAHARKAADAQLLVHAHHTGLVAGQRLCGADLDTLAALVADGQIPLRVAQAGGANARLAAVDGLEPGLGTDVLAQAAADAEYFIGVAGDGCTATERMLINDTFLAAYRWQYVYSGVEDRRFRAILNDMLTPAQLGRVEAALASLGEAPPAAAA